MVKRVLMVAFHFPPMNVSRGIQRTLRFAEHLPEYGWEPIVLTVHHGAYASVSNASLSDIPAEVTLYRTTALDAARHLSIGGRYPRALAVPDRWASWWCTAVPRGLRVIRRLKPTVL